MPKERMIDAERLKADLRGLYELAGWGEREVHFSLADMDCNIDMEDSVEAIRADDNFGFAAYIIENNKYGIRVEESWNKDLDDEEMMAVITGLIQDILADERLTRLWNDATELAKFMMGVGDNIARVS